VLGHGLLELVGILLQPLLELDRLLFGGGAPLLYDLGILAFPFLWQGGANAVADAVLFPLGVLHPSLL